MEDKHRVLLPSLSPSLSLFLPLSLPLSLSPSLSLSFSLSLSISHLSHPYSSSHVEEVELTEQYRMWAIEAGKMFGGLDICTVDAIHTKDGKEYILEVNGTSSGLLPSLADVDNRLIRDVVLERMKEVL
jgi:hypothetical protein